MPDMSHLSASTLAPLDSATSLATPSDDTRTMESLSSPATSTLSFVSTPSTSSAPLEDASAVGPRTTTHDTSTITSRADGNNLQRPPTNLQPAKRVDIEFGSFNELQVFLARHGDTRFRSTLTLSDFDRGARKMSVCYVCKAIVDFGSWKRHIESMTHNDIAREQGYAHLPDEELYKYKCGVEKCRKKFHRQYLVENHRELAHSIPNTNHRSGRKRAAAEDGSDAGVSRPISRRSHTSKTKSGARVKPVQFTATVPNAVVPQFAPGSAKLTYNEQLLVSQSLRIQQLEHQLQESRRELHRQRAKPPTLPSDLSYPSSLQNGYQLGAYPALPRAPQQSFQDATQLDFYAATEYMAPGDGGLAPPVSLSYTQMAGPSSQPMAVTPQLNRPLSAQGYAAQFDPLYAYAAGPSMQPLAPSFEPQLDAYGYNHAMANADPAIGTMAMPSQADNVDNFSNYNFS